MGTFLPRTGRTELALAGINANVDICSPEPPALVLFLLGIKKKHAGNKIKYTRVALAEHNSVCSWERGQVGRAIDMGTNRS